MDMHQITGNQLENTLAQAIALHQAGRFKEAENLYLKVLSMGPKSAVVLSNLGLVMQSQERMDEGVSFFHRALMIDSTSPLIYRNLGLLLMQAGDLESARRSILAAVDLVPLTPENYVLRRELSTDLMVGLNDPVTSCKIAINQYDYSAIPPLRVRLEPSSACNLRCQHCPTGTLSHHGNKGMMEMETFDNILAQLKELPTVREAILYLGGEPLLNKHLPAMCRKIKEKSSVTYTQFTTNAMLLTEKTCRRLAETALNKIVISIDGRTPRENDRIRQGADYCTVRKNVDTFMTFNTSTHVEIANTIVKKSNDPDVPETPDFLLHDFRGIPVATQYAMKWPQFNPDKSGLAGMHLASIAPDGFCAMPFNQIAIKANGDVIPCCYDLLGEIVLGNMHRSELARIWNNDRYRNLRRAMIQNESGLLPGTCRKCSVFTGELPVIRN